MSMREYFIILCAIIFAGTHGYADELKTATVSGVQWTYSIANGSATIENYWLRNLGGGSYEIRYKAAIPTSTSGAINIPKKLGGYPVTSIAENAFKDCAQITSVVFPTNNTICFPTASLFSGCDRLKSVTVPADVLDNNFGAYNFQGANVLEEILAPCCSAKYSSIDGILCDKGASQILIIPCAKTELTIPESLTSFPLFDLSTGCTIKKINVSSLTKWLSISFGGAEVNGERHNPLTFGADLYVNGELLTDCNIPDGISTINYNSFFGCSSITNITLPDSVSEIKAQAFAECTNVCSIVISSNIVEIQNTAFQGCRNLKTIMLENGCRLSKVGFGIGGSISEKFPYVEKVFLSGEWSCIPYQMFSGCQGLKDIVIPEGVTEIELYAFNDCSHLNTIELPSTLTKIWMPSFDGCSNLTSFVVAQGNKNFTSQNGILYTEDMKSLLCCPGGVEMLSISDATTGVCAYACSKCSKLKEVTFSSNVVFVGDSAFYGCEALTSIEFPASIETIGGSAFERCLALDSIVLLSHKECTVGAGAFQQCGSLTNFEAACKSISFKSNVFGDDDFGYCPISTVRARSSVIKQLPLEKIRSMTFLQGETEISGCGTALSLEKVSIPTSALDIAESAFAECSNLRYVAMPNGITNIGDYAFYRCKALSLTNLPTDVNAIGSFAFCECDALSSALIPKGVAKIGNSAFRASGIRSLSLPSTLEEIPAYAFYGCKHLNEVETSWGLKGIGDYAFSFCTNLHYIALPRGLSQVGTGTFEFCNALRGIEIPSSIVRFGPSALENCELFRQINIEQGSEQVVMQALRIKESVDGNSSVENKVIGSEQNVRTDWSNILIESKTRKLFYDINEFQSIFSSGTEVNAKINSDSELTAFCSFLTSCGVSDGGDLTENEKEWAYKSYKFANVVVTPTLFDEEPRLTISKCTLDGANLAMSIKLDVGDESVNLLKAQMADKIRIGTSLDVINDVPNIISMPSEDGKELTFVIQKPSGEQGYIKVVVE